MTQSRTLTRRRLLHLVGRAGGVQAAYSTMAAMGLLPAPDAYAGAPPLELASGTGIRVAIVGAGIAGMVAAYELGKAGYLCTVLEARSRAGGRVRTLRGGDQAEEIDSRQEVAWDAGEHMYFNAGAARIPHHHRGILAYCRELAVPLEVMVNDNRAAYFHDENAFGGKPQAARAVVSDARGFVAELAAKAVDKAALDLPVSAEDRGRLLAMLRSFGALDRDLTYRGSERAGFAEPPGTGAQAGSIKTPIDLSELLRSDFWAWKMPFSESFAQAATMLQPVGGMDRITDAFAKALGEVVTYNAEVVRMRRTEAGARVEWRDRTTGTMRAVEAAYVICTAPLPVLARLDADFSPELKAALPQVYYVPAGKVAFQADRRFWEEDLGIYGGISWTNQEITQIWYPSAGFHAPKGILVGAYLWSDAAGRSFAAQSPETRLARAVACGEKIHPGYGQEVAKGVSVAWSRVPFALGAWAEFSPEGRRRLYPILLRPDGPYHLAGEHLSHINGWQEGAVRSAHHAVADIAARVHAKRI